VVLAAASLAGDFASLQTRLAGFEFYVESKSDDNRRWIVMADKAEQPATYFLSDRDQQSITELFRARPALISYRLAPMHSVHVKARDGLDLVSYLTLPANIGGDRPPEPLPMVLLVHGGSSGIGTTAIQMARAFSSRVLVTAGTPEKCAACVALGAERAIDYRREDFVAATREATGGRGADVILDMVGAPYLTRNLECLAVDGRLVQIGVQQGPKAELNLLTVMHNRLTVTGSTLRPRTVAEKGAIAAVLRAQVWPKIEAGAMRPVIHARLPLADAREAHRILEEGGHIGKLVLLV
jgi:NADPH:quinone reductase-like Zn-dependent oxidoreductase